MKKKTVKIIWICIAAALVAAVGLICVHYIGLKPIVTVECGDPLPAVESIARAGDSYADAYGVLSLGTHVVWIRHNGVKTPVLVRVRDTVAPTGEPRAQAIVYGTTLTPDKLVTKIRDENVVKVSFAEPFDFDRIGDFDVEILLKDASGNQSTVASHLSIRAVKDSVALEAGSPVPGADAFLLDGVSGEPETLPTTEMMHHVGTYPVRVLLPNGQIATSELTVTDTVPPTGESTSLWVRPGDPITPEMLVSKPSDATDLTFTFVNEPDETATHVQKITVRMTDEGGNSVDIESDLAVSRIEPFTVEASDEPITADLFSDAGTIVFEQPFVPDTVGIYTIPVTADGAADFVLITVKDTTAPKVEKRADAKLYTLHAAEPDAVFSAQDYSPIQMTWITAPDWNASGEQTVCVRAEDASGNAVVVSDTVVLSADTEPPELYGVVNRTAYVGEPIAYLSEVYAMDAVDGRTAVTVESDVQPEQAGTYRVVYSTEDASGNRASVSCEFTLVVPTVSDEEVRALAQGVLKKIVTDDMTTAEKLKAVYDYIHKGLHYSGGSDKTDWRKEAVRGFKKSRGDCFTFYSVTRALLDELGVEYMSVTRVGWKSQHFWVIVNIGTGWYHFDAINYYRWNKCFMWTNEECEVGTYFWRYDHSKYPEIATERFNYDEVVRMEKEGLLP